MDIMNPHGTTMKEVKGNEGESYDLGGYGEKKENCGGGTEQVWKEMWLKAIGVATEMWAMKKECEAGHTSIRGTFGP